MIWATPEWRTRLTFELFLISFLALYAELVVIRWLASEVRVFAYYRIDFSPLFIGAPAEPGGAVQVGYTLDVNRDFHQRALNMSVEIDPAILDLGRRFHPEGPYRVDGVRVINNDARAFFRQTDGRYDLIIFGFLDSHTMFSSLSSLRLDNYVYTVESLREAIGHLTPRGILALSFRRAKEASGALAANMFGALIGGILEYTSMAMGIRSLTVLALLLYGLSWLGLLFRGWRLGWVRA